ncbi:MAG: alpha/beta fold hydrolase, partial [Allobranchiibius sp.]
MADGEGALSCGDVIQSFLKLSTPGAIEETVTVELGGIPQVVTIRGADRSNPVLLFVHVGPGTPLAPTAWMWQRPIEDFFTIVHYDQRAAGRSHALTDPDTVRAAMRIKDYVHDAVHLTEWLCRKLGVDQVLLASHSWGTVIATKAVLARPDLFTAYLGVGQVVNFRAAEQSSFDWVLQEAHRHRDEHAIQELQSLMPYPGEGPLDAQKLITQRRWVTTYGGYAAGRSDCDYFVYGEVTSPDYQGLDQSA